MTAGDTPQSLADLIRRVGQLEAMRVFPPLSMQTTPAGAVISFIDDATGATPATTLYAARAHRISDQFIAKYVSVGAVDVVYEATNFDHGGFFDPLSPSRLTAPVDGVYVVGAQVSWLAAPPDAVLHLFIYASIGGVISTQAIDTFAVPKAAAVTSTECAQSVATIVELQAGDYVKATVGNIDVNDNYLVGAGSYTPVLWIHKVAVG